MEEWREIPGWPAYDISSKGRIKVRRSRNGKKKGLSYADVQTFPALKGEKYVNMQGVFNGVQTTILNHPVSELFDSAFGLKKEIKGPIMIHKPIENISVKKIRFCNKAVFADKKEAEYKINFLNNLGVGKKKDKSGLRAYPCGKCKGWHLTSKPLNGRKY